MAQTHLDLGRRERQIMEAVYRLRRASVNDVLAQLPDPPSYSSVRAMLGKLQRKGYLRQEQDGPRYIYTPALSREKARRTALMNLLDTFFNGSAEQAAVALLQMSDTAVPATVLDRLHERVRRARKEGR